MAVYFTSDTHFNDPRVLRIDKRPFPDLASHDEALIGYWNSVVSAQDMVWHLGDFARGDDAFKQAILEQLHGHKHLIIGNNDDAGTIEAPQWASVGHYTELHQQGMHLILCHYAFRTWNKMGNKSVNLHGHSHGKLSHQTRQYDVGVDAWDYHPISLERLLAPRAKAKLAP
jgi:calcineurin-like phosphoesterase family protein